MFTGIIEHVSTLSAVSAQGADRMLQIDLGPLLEGTRLGDSIAVNGICLTVAKLEGRNAFFQAGAETLRKSTAGQWRTGSRVNLERALALGDRLGGHMVSGHVDGIGRIHARRPEGKSERFEILLPEDGSVRVVEKGSITVDGISLTTWECSGRRCAISVIQHTLAHTTLGQARPGTAVNLEQDLIGRWVAAMVTGGV
ncbi:MAG: riboflavin synthase [Planctomycetota bacterium]|nr:MAG: riboflavin synthase [Planctomycetota bacterium]